MKTSFKIRAAALVASILVTFGAVKMMAEYAYPTAPAAHVQLASAGR
jgi:hypothetical protein